MTAKEKLQDLLVEASGDTVAHEIKRFCAGLSDEQAEKLLALDGFTAEYKIPIWDDDLDGAAKNANRKHDKEPDRYILSKTEPKRIAEDLALFLNLSQYDPVGLVEFFNMYIKLDHPDNEYFKRILDIITPAFPPIPRVGGKRVKNLVITTDLVNQKIWNQSKEGNVSLAIDSDIGKKTVTTYFRINFDELPQEITKKLTRFDELVYEAASNLWLAGNQYVSAGMIYGVHNNGSAGDDDIEKIDKSLSKMMAAQISLSNEQEARVSNYPLFVYDGSMLPMERQRCYINGRLVESAIHIFREPPFFSWARERGHLTTIDQKQGIIPLNKTEKNLALRKYLLRIIGAAKTGAIKNKITYDTIFQEIGVNQPMQKTRTKEYTKRLFAHFVTTGFIKSFKEDKTGISFTWEKTTGNLL